MRSLRTLPLLRSSKVLCMDWARRMDEEVMTARIGRPACPGGSNRPQEWQGPHGMSAPVASLNHPQVGLDEPLVASHVVPVSPPVCMITYASAHRSLAPTDGSCPSDVTAGRPIASEDFVLLVLVAHA